MYRFAILALFLAAQSGTDDIVSSFLGRKEEPLLSYKGNQRLEGKGFGRVGWVEASTEFSLQNGLSYTVTSSGGELRIVNRALLPFLEAEKKSVAPTTAFTSRNYEFESYGQQGGPAMLKITPKRQEAGLLNGVMFLSEDGDLLRVEGSPAKSPSVWTWDEKVVREYGQVQGIRVPLKMSSTAKIFTASTSLKVQYSYREINGKSSQ